MSAVNVDVGLEGMTKEEIRQTVKKKLLKRIGRNSRMDKKINEEIPKGINKKF